MAKIELLGAKELIGEFQRLNDIVATQYVEQSLQAGAEVGLEALIRAEPEATGLLKQETRLETTLVTRTRVEKQIVIGKDAYYWRFLAFGTKYIPAMTRFRNAFKNRKSTARQTIRDTFRDRIYGFKD